MTLHRSEDILQANMIKAINEIWGGCTPSMGGPKTISLRKSTPEMHASL